MSYDETSLKTIEQLKGIFHHYSKLKHGLRSDHTFEDIKEHHEVLTINKVTSFLQDFQIAANPMVPHIIILTIFILESNRTLQEVCPPEQNHAIRPV